MAVGSASRGAVRRKHRLFGLTLASEYRFESRLAPGRGAADLAFTLSSSAPAAFELGEPVFESPLKDDAGDSKARLYSLAEGELLRFGQGLDFHLGAEAVHCHLRDPTERYLVEIRLLGSVLSYWLERRGVLALHASAVVVDGRAVAFMAANQGGKTGLAAALMAAGSPLLSDDVLPVEERGGRLFARSGYPQVRMWPDEVRHFVADWRRLDPVHPRLGKRRVPVGEDGFGRFHPDAAPLHRLYLPERRPPGRGGEEVRCEPLPARRAVVELVRCSFSPFIVEAVGLQPKRLDLLARLAERVPVRRLTYPAGFHRLPEVARAVAADLEAP